MLGIWVAGVVLLLQSYIDGLIAYQESRNRLVQEAKVVPVTQPIEKVFDQVEEVTHQDAPLDNQIVATDSRSKDKAELVSSYINRFAKVARIEQQKFGIPASISLAQGLVESRYGTSSLARKANNHFGIKCHSKRCAKGHCVNATDDSHKDFFRIYGNAWESWRAHSQLLAGKRYAKLKKHGRDYRKWAQGLEQLGYATDRSYAEKLIGVIEKYDLHRYDR